MYLAAVAHVTARVLRVEVVDVREALQAARLLEAGESGGSQWVAMSPT
jgi:hypothetical protein